MCMQDLWIGAHTTFVVRTPGTSIVLPANNLRIGFVVGGGFDVELRVRGTVAWYKSVYPRIVTAATTADTNEVPPTDNTGTWTASAQSTTGPSSIFRIEQYGSIIREEVTVLSNANNVSVVELIADAALAEMLNKLEYSENWPLYGLPPKNKVPNG